MAPSGRNLVADKAFVNGAFGLRRGEGPVDFGATRHDAQGVAPGAHVLWLEHSVANMYLIAAGWVAGAEVTLGGYLANLVPVRLGNIVGGAGGVAIGYRLANGAA